MSFNLLQQLNRQVILLSVQFLLGMAVNLIGLPGETQGIAHVATLVFLWLHILVALGLFVNSLILVKLARPYGSKAQRWANFGVASIVTAMICGMLTLTAPLSNLWSYIMAVAFLAVFGFYGRLLQVIRELQNKKHVRKLHRS